MLFPNLSNSLYVAKLRYIQTIHESDGFRNPDVLVRHFIPFWQRFQLGRLNSTKLAALRSDPFYYYLVARTRYYDQVVEDAIADGVTQVIGVGSGSDTRAYRFQDLLAGKGLQILECDQAESIRAKQALTRRWRKQTHVDHLAIDLNDGSWPELESRIMGKPKALVLIEGVSPYINADEFPRFLKLLGSRLGSGSHLAYDFKIAGIKDEFGSGERTKRPFRLTTDAAEVATFHHAYGLQLEQMELSAELCARLLPALPPAPAFREDVLLRLRVV